MQSPEAVSAVGKLSYNQLVEKIITCKHSSDTNLVTEGDVPPFPSVDLTWREWWLLRFIVCLSPSYYIPLACELHEREFGDLWSFSGTSPCCPA